MQKSDVNLIIISVTVVAVLFAILYFFHKKDMDAIDNNLATTTGIIIDNNKEAKGSWGVRVKYEVNGICYVRHFDSTEWCQFEKCVGDSVKVEYSAEDPNIARIINRLGKTQYPSSKIGNQDYTVECIETF